MLSRHLIDDMISKCHPPTGIWKDFNHDYKWFKYLKRLSESGKLKKDDLPADWLNEYGELVGPNPNDYNDTISEGVRS